MRKVSANYIYSPDRGFIKNGILKLEDDGAIISLEDTGAQLKEEAGLEHYNGIICPGFVNAHCHLELSHMKGQIPQHIGLDNFVYEVVTGRHYAEETIMEAIRKGDEEMQKEGIVAVGDISNTDHSFKEKSGSRIFYHTFVEIFNMQNDQAEQTFESGLHLLETARKKYGLSASVVPHASYSVSEELFRLFRERMNGKDNLLSIHNLETEHENPFIAERKGNLLEVFEKIGLEKGDSKPRNMNSMPWLSRMIPHESPLLLVHNVYLTPEDIEESDIDTEKTWYSLCPNSNLYIANVLPGIFLMENYPDKVCIGTDSLSSNRRLSILAELFTLNENYPEIGLEKLLQFATINGAEMLGVDDWAGSFEAGKKPGVNLIERVDLEGMRLRGEGVVRVLVGGRRQ